MMSVYSEDQTCMKRILTDAEKWHSLPIRRLMRYSCDQAFKYTSKFQSFFAVEIRKFFSTLKKRWKSVEIKRWSNTFFNTFWHRKTIEIALKHRRHFNVFSTMKNVEWPWYFDVDWTFIFQCSHIGCRKSVAKFKVENRHRIDVEKLNVPVAKFFLDFVFIKTFFPIKVKLPNVGMQRWEGIQNVQIAYAFCFVAGLISRTHHVCWKPWSCPDVQYVWFQ